jgi:hypothetical protein
LVARLVRATFIKTINMNIAYTVQPNNQPSQAEWMKEFKVGLMAPKPREGRDRALSMMKEFNFRNVCKNLKP